MVARGRGVSLLMVGIIIGGFRLLPHVDRYHSDRPDSMPGGR